MRRVSPGGPVRFSGGEAAGPAQSNASFDGEQSQRPSMMKR